MKITFFSLCLILITCFSLNAQNPPTFSQFQTVEQRFKTKKTDLKSDTRAKQYQRELKNSSKRGVNFAGQSVLTELSCGADCRQYAIVNAKTGKVFFPAALQDLAAADKIIEYKPDSRLLILDYAGERKSGEVELFGKNRYYEWTGSELLEIDYPAGRKSFVSRVILPEFKPIISRLTRKTQVPILLPSLIPEPKFLPKIVPLEEGAQGLAFFSFPIQVTDAEFELTLDIASGCQGNPNCNYGRFAGKKNNTAEPVTVGGIPFEAQKAKKVTLANGIEGFYIPAPDSPRAIIGSRVFWLDGKGNQYALSLRRAPKDDVIAMANSAINNFSGPR